MPDKNPKWLFWVKATAAVIALLVGINTLLLLFSDDTTPLGRIAEYVSEMISDQTICHPDTSTPEEFDVCLQQGGVER